MEAIRKDIRYGVRMLRKNPGFSLVAVLTLALGIGANTAIFSMVDSILLRPLPVKDPQQITVLAFQQKQGSPQSNFSIAAFRDLRSQTREVFSALTGYQIGLDGLSMNGRPDRIATYYVPGNFFPTLGIQPALGRFILPSEGEVAGADPVMVLGYKYWKNRFGGDSAIIGRKATVNGHPVTIVGVAPPEFYGIYTVLDTQAYLPLGMASIEGYPADLMTNRQLRNMFVLGRLKSGVDLGQAQALLSVVGQRLAKQYPVDEKDLTLEVYPELRARPNPDPKNQLAIIGGLFLGLAIMVLLLACVNVTNILLVRATVREREMAIRVALGAGRAGLIRQLLTESLLLATAGGVAGILFGSWGSAMLGSIRVATDLPMRLDFSFDWRVFCYAFGIALVTGIVVGIVPAVRASRANVSEVLHQGGRGVIAGRHRLRAGLVMAQVGGSLALLIIAGLFTRSLSEVQRAKLGFEPAHVLNLAMDPTEIGYNDAQGRAFYRNLLDRVRALPGVESASTANAVPLGYYGNGDNLAIDGYQTPAGQPAPSAAYNIVSPSYFKTLRIDLVRGRMFADNDNEAAPYVAIINEAMAKKFWPGKDVVGRQFKLATDPQHLVRIAGVAKDSRTTGLTGSIQPYFYLPLAQHYAGNSLATLQVRTAGDPGGMAPEVQHVIASLAPDMPVFDVKTMVQALYTLNGLLIFQIAAGLAATLGVLGLILAVVGVYGVISYTASQQTHEIGIRMALGAKPFAILSLMFRQGFLIIGGGLVLGLGAAFAAASVVGSFLVVSATDPLTYTSVTALLTAVALLACFIPARRAMRVDPMVALRHE